MAKLGLARHRYTIAVLCWFYVIIALLSHIYLIFNFDGAAFVILSIDLLIGCFGLYCLFKENGSLMKILGVIFAILAVLGIVELIGVLIMSIMKTEVIDAFLNHLMDGYYKSDEKRKRMDEIQTEFQCCGRQSYKDWTLQPFSCCKTENCFEYYDGCADALSPIISWIFLLGGVVCIVSVIFHIYGAISAFNLAKVYNRKPILPHIKHSFANY